MTMRPSTGGLPPVLRGELSPHGRPDAHLKRVESHALSHEGVHLEAG